MANGGYIKGVTIKVPLETRDQIRIVQRVWGGTYAEILRKAITTTYGSLEDLKDEDIRRTRERCILFEG